jgi:hypothetical protein
MDTPMKQRNIFAVLFLSIITLGIYDLYWLYKTKKVLNDRTKVHTPSLWLLLLPLIIALVLIVAAFALGLANSHSSTSTTLSSPGSGSATSQVFSTTPKSDGVVPLIAIFGLEFVAVIVIIPITFYWYFKFSKAVNEFTNGELSTGVTFLLMWILRFIGIMIVQDKFNDMIAAEQLNTQPNISLQTDSTNSASGTLPARPVVPPETTINQSITPAVDTYETRTINPEPISYTPADSTSTQSPSTPPETATQANVSVPENAAKADEEPLFLPEHGVPDAPTEQTGFPSDKPDSDD